MAEAKPLYSTCVAVLGFICFVVGATAVGIPMWGYFISRNDLSSQRWSNQQNDRNLWNDYNDGGHERGYFGPWKICKLLLYNRERCGQDSSLFKPTIAVWLAGIVASLGVAVLGVFCILSVIQLAMISSREKVVMKYSVVVFIKLALGLLSALLAIAAAGLFAFQADNTAGGYQITRGPAFYIQVLLIIFNSALFVTSLYDMLFSRREGGDPTKTSSPKEPTTYGNIGYRDQGTNGRGGISMTDASAKPYAQTGASNGSMASMHTTSTTIGSTNGSTTQWSVGTPLRSSLKKPKPKEGLGIQNPGFSGTSPTMSRNGSMKKVRIQTHSTEV